MNATREDLHRLIDIVDSKEILLIYQLLMKFISEDEPVPDEIAAIKEAHAQGGYVNAKDIDWDAPEK